MFSLPRLMLVGAAIAIAGCTAKPAESPPPGSPLPAPPPGAGPQMLLGVNWKITEVDGETLPETSTASMAFADGRISGSGGCNRLMGSYEAGQNFSIKLSRMASTMMACPEDRMRQEDRLSRLLEQVNHYTFDASGNLILATPDGKTIRATRG